MKKYIIALMALTAIVCLNTIQVQAVADIDKIEHGIYIDEIDLSDKTISEAQQTVNAHIESLKGKEITLKAMNGNAITMTAGEMGLSWVNKEVLDEAVGLGKDGNIVQRYKALRDLKYENKVYSFEFSFDQNTISSVIEEECAEFNVNAVDSTLKRENGNFVIEEGQTGVVIDNEKSVKTIVDYMNSEWNGENGSVELVVDVDEPRGTEEELSKVKDVLGSFHTSYPQSSADRSGNISNASAFIDGTLLYPGDTFSTLNTITPFTLANGYFPAGSYLNGQVVDSVGGGICQVSTTLYNAVLNAELDIEERHNHSMTVGYVDPSKDAMISEGAGADFKFTNNTGAPVYIESYTSNKVVYFTIYGAETRPGNREVIYDSKVISTREPEGEKVVGDSGMAFGSISISSAHKGMVAELWKVVKEDGAEVSRTQVNKSSYRMTPRTATVGTATADPNLAAALNEAIATQNIEHVRSVANALKADPSQAGAGGAPNPTEQEILDMQEQMYQDALRQQQEQQQQQGVPPAE